jgi:DNA helicase IV
MFARSIARGVTVFADENQRLTSQNSTLDEIRDKIRPDLELQLTCNYRNTFEIAALAAHFHTGPSADVPKPPDGRGPKPSLHAHADRNHSVQHIATYAGNYRRQQVGVLVQNTTTLKAYRKRLRASLPSDVPVQYYDSKEEGLKVDFDSSGIFIVNWASAKGLEFDAVFLPELQAVRRQLDDPTLLMQLYVLCSRARERLFLSYTGPGTPAITGILPAEHIEDMT